MAGLRLLIAGCAGALLLATSVANAQTQRIEPAPLPPESNVATSQSVPPAPAPYPTGTNNPPTPVDSQPAATPPANPLQPCVQPHPSGSTGDMTYHRDDLIGAGEGVFGKGAKGLGQMIERILKSQGEPNAYIAGHEAGGAFIVGLRYGSGALCHKVEGQRPVYWTGPSVGFDAGGDASKVFVLVYNLYDTQDLYRRYGEVEGRAFYVGGLSATYMRRGNIVLIPVRLGVGLRLGANLGYMKFREKNSWSPF